MRNPFTTEWLMSRGARTSAKVLGVAIGPADAVEYEIPGLHAPIKADCAQRGWRYIYSDPTKPTTIGEGVCDFIIFADRGRVFFIECKSKTGKLKDSQRIFICWMEKLGFKVHVITAMSEYLEIIK